MLPAFRDSSCWSDSATSSPDSARRTQSPRELDPRRKFDAADYFSMVLFTLLNPVVDTM